MYSREKLSEYIDIALRHDAANGMLTEIMGELTQIPVVMSTDENDELSTDDIPKYVNDNEIFTENANYLTEKNDFMIFNSEGKMILRVLPDNSIKGTGELRFSIPLDNQEDKEAFLDFCDRLQRNSAVKYPSAE